MTKLDDKTVCIVDNGLFTELAVTLSQSFGQTFYFSSWQTSFPRSNALSVGQGIPGVIRIDHIWPIVPDVDLFVFPDVYHGPLQVFLREELGKRVWGSGLGEALELNRGKSKQWLRDIGLPVGPFRALRGTAELRRHLQMHDDQYVKSNTRGDMETFHAQTYELIEPRIDELDHVLGAKKGDYLSIVEEPIEAALEIGYDGFSVDGAFPSRALFGVEAKDSGYVGQVVRYNALPKPLRYVNERLAPTFADLKYRGFWSSEVRVDPDGVPFLIDPCCRMASPPGELYQYMITNLADVIWAGAEGELIEPKWRDEWGAELVLKSDWAVQGWQPVDFPDEIRENVKLHYLSGINDRLFVVPQQPPIPEIGAVVATGPTKQAAIRAVTKIAEQVRGYDIKFDVAALERAASDMEKLAA